MLDVTLFVILSAAKDRTVTEFGNNATKEPYSIP